MKSTVSILIGSLLIIGLGVGYIFYQKMQFDLSSTILENNIQQATDLLKEKDARIAELEKQIADAQKALETKPATAPIVLVGGNAINVDDHQAGSKIASVSFAILEKPGFVVIHKEVNNQPGTVIGNSVMLPQGKSNNITIILTESLTTNSNYYAMLHVDQGDGVYTKVDEDLPAKDALGNVVMMKFTASAEPAVK
ncbi:MAG: hypothetical protein WC810_26690 [Janthinobacterium sp.]|jgi:hypothetical protein